MTIYILWNSFFLVITMLCSCKSRPTNSMIDTKKIEQITLSAGNSILEILSSKEYESLLSHIHPTDGIRFSPYGYVNVKDHLHFTREEFSKQLSTNKTLIWGYTDGRGDPMLLDTEGYFSKWVYDTNYLEAERTSYNKIIQSGNSLINMTEVYPDSYFVEYNFSGFDEKFFGMDWRSLRLVFKFQNRKPYLVAIIHDKWTI